MGGEDTGAAAAEEFPKVPLRVFFFLRKSSCSILPLNTRKGLSFHTAQLSTLPGKHPQPQCVYHFILIPLPTTSSTQVSLGVAQALFGRGGSINLALSQESCGRPGGLRPGAAVALFPLLVPGAFLS